MILDLAQHFKWQNRIHLQHDDIKYKIAYIITYVLIKINYYFFNKIMCFETGLFLDWLGPLAKIYTTNKKFGIGNFCNILEEVYFAFQLFNPKCYETLFFCKK